MPNLEKTSTPIIFKYPSGSDPTKLTINPTAIFLKGFIY
jgi:hypothetical protein